MIRHLAALAAASLLAAPALAQDHDMHDKGAQDAHAGHDMAAMAEEPAAQDAPPSPHDSYAERSFPAGEMARARAAMMRESGGVPTWLVLLDLAEYQARSGRDGYRWEGEAWFGGDVDRLTLKSEGEGSFGDRIETAEVQALYSRAIGPYFNLQAGVRQDIRPRPAPTYAALGFEGLAPYRFEVEGAAFLSTRGDLLGRLGGWHDQRVTQRLVLQPRVALDFAAQDVPERRLGAGLTDAEIGLRLRYEIRREFAPYVGVSWERRIGRTARFARADGEGTGGFVFVAGIRTWF